MLSYNRLVNELKTPKQMERHLKGISNHYRIAIILLIDKNKNITLEGIVGSLKANQKTISEHTRRLMSAGLIEKSYSGNYVEHRLSPYGKKFVSFLKSLQKSF